LGGEKTIAGGPFEKKGECLKLAYDLQADGLS
jgi:hypothetical protein